MVVVTKCEVELRLYNNECMKMPFSWL
jgi:hypothetical protein